MNFSPVNASKHIKEKYYRYLKTYFKIGEPYKEEYEKLIDSGDNFSAGPYLDVTDAFKKGKSIDELIKEGILPKSFVRINMKLTRPLYLHQEKAIRKIAVDGKNIVVSTGTGSGKTESFLLPVLRELALESEAGTLCPGVRALMIYPMNALANDQTERLRSILENYPEITFGVYTGQTKQKYSEALADYKSLNNDSVPHCNELISRDQMIETPPHILITNYAMLEYLMLRPKESVFFEGQYAEHWKFIIFDEAHVYNGSTGIEVSMLFRRLKAKIGKQDITYILTSATLGDKEDNEAVAEFAHNLCNAPFDKDDVIRADRIIPFVSNELASLPTTFYEDLANAANRNLNNKEMLEILGISDKSNFNEELYEKIVHDNNYWKMRSLLSSPNTVSNIARNMGWTEKQLTDFVTVASLAEKDGAQLFDARYHMFLRATESVFVTLNPDNHVLLDRCSFRYNKENGQSFKVFEAAVCSYCSAVYLVGKIDHNNKLEQYNASDEIESKELFLLENSISDTDDNHTLEDEGIAAELYEICPYCGFVRKDNKKEHCEHNTSLYVKAYKVRFKNDSHTLTKCLHCENVNTSGVIRMFFSGQEAATSVIGTALFEELPSHKISMQTHEADDFGYDFGYTEEIKEKIAKQFIAFSDNRQAAAFYASYLNISYNNILYKRLIVETLKKIKNEEGYSVPSFVDMLQTEFEKNGVKGKIRYDSDEAYNVKKEAWKAVLSELIDNNGNTSLFRFGLIGIEADISGNYKKFNISDTEFKSLCSIFSMSVMADAAIEYSEAPLNGNDLEDFTHGSAVYSYTISDSSGKNVKSFIPTKSGFSNKRVDYIQKVVAAKTGAIISNNEATDFLVSLWEKRFKGNLFVNTQGNAYKVDPNKIKIIKPTEWFICNKCKRLTCHNIANVCPEYHCDGKLMPVNSSEMFRDNHYYRIYNDMEIRDLRIVEHTAQLDRDKAYDYQKRFKQKDIDILSCSTTFEMGVDVGDLETVFMRNMPPTPSNYAQRAGRAGRSKQSAAYALTFCNKSSHDFSYFADPTRMIKGKITPPKFKIENDKIAIRHLYAASLSFFWRIHCEFFGTIGQFFETDETHKSGFDCLKEYLRSCPEILKDYLKLSLPRVLLEKFEVETFGWVDSLIGEEGVLTEAVKTYQYEVSLLEDVKKERIANNSPTDSITQRIKAYSSENIISFMSKKNILPKYGFPVDTVEMTVTNNKQRKNYGLQLQRDLSMAISEYAPGSQIVANNNLITSRYIKKIPNIGWKMYSYIQCDNCKTLNIKPYTEGKNNSAISMCCQCHSVFQDEPKVFLIPAQGFVADGDKIRKPGLKKPVRTYRGEISYVGFNNNADEYHYNIGKAIISVRTSQNDEMAVLNTSPFYVCEQCGYTEVDESHFTSVKRKKHNISSGYPCSNNQLKKFSLGYRFLTDVVRIRFENYEINEWEKGLSILHGFLRGACSCLNIEEGDISGCLQSDFAEGRINYSIVIFDNTPGGSGHAKRLNDQKVLHEILRYTLEYMSACRCGGDEGDSSCYSCLRNYRNQKYHDVLKRKYVIEFISNILNTDDNLKK